jgi:capsular exopolysaccharide synthesis family protein
VIEMGLFNTKSNHSRFSNDAHRKTLHKNLNFVATEQYKLLRANLNFTIPQGEKCPVIGVTSSMRGEGKSTTSINLAYVLAESGKKVLLMDGDLRIPSIAKKLELNGSVGVTDYLMGKKMDMEQFRSALAENWYILPSGNIPPNPSELLGSSRMEKVLNDFREQFDYIIIDLPPVNIVSDAISISGLITGIVLVIREEYTEKKDLERCFRQLNLSNVNVLGCVMNEARSGDGSYGRYKKYRYYKYYKYYRYEYEYKTDEDGNKQKVKTKKTKNDKGKTDKK